MQPKTNRQIREGFFAGSNFSSERHKQLIAESHERSRCYGIDPDMVKAPTISKLTAAQLKNRIRANQLFFDLATAQMSNLFNLLKGSGFCIALADREGYILHIMGDQNLLQQYHKRNCVPGFRWREKDIGTCAIGLILETLTSVQISGKEMYSHSAHHITNSGAPVFDHENRLLGVIVVSGLVKEVHVHTLGMVLMAAESIRSQIKEFEKSRELALKNSHMTSLLESDHRGVIALDKKGRVIQWNRKAGRLLKPLGVSSSAQLNTVLKSNRELMSLLRKGKGFWEEELTYTWNHNRKTFISSLDPIILPNGEIAGGLLLLLGKKRVMKLVNKMVGSQAHFTFDSIIGNSAYLRAAVKMAKVAAKGSASVMLCGETGTGKELFAQAIHNAGPRRDHPFVVINCGAIPRELLESELFGYTEGAFTGALKGGRPGKFELADGGTLFLDEIGDMAMDMQVKILRALQSGEIYRIGESQPAMVDLRIISATHVDLDSAIAQGNFRQDLFYRISTFRIDIPALRKRAADIPDLAHAFLERLRESLQRKDLVFSRKALDCISHYHWCGNIRQLENSIERAANVAENGVITADDLGLTSQKATAELFAKGKATLLTDLEKKTIMALMKENKGNVSKVSRLLGISRPTLYRKLKTYNLCSTG